MYYAAIFSLNLLTAGGTAILLSGIIASFIMPDYGLGRAARCFFRTCRQLRFPIATTAMALGLAFIMNYSGMSSTLALAFTKTGRYYPFFAPILGWLGVFPPPLSGNSRKGAGNPPGSGAEGKGLPAFARLP